MSNPPLIQRHLRPLVSSALADTPAVLINGPRQCGKTTLVKAYGGSHAYVTLDDPIQLAAVKADPVGFIRRHDLVTIDEIQRAPELLLAIKLAIDQDRRPGRFLLTGSANLMALPTVAESLAGRMEIHTLLPLSNAELAGHSPDFLERARAQQWPVLTSVSPPVSGAADALAMQVLAGGYPEMRQRATPARRQAWARAYMTTLVERDIRDIAQIEQIARMPQLLSILASLSGQLLNLNQIGGQVGLNAKTVEKYIDILENIFLVRRLPAWSRNELSRLVKTPKIHFLDAGLQAALTRLNMDLVFTERSRFGATLETWVHGELLKILSVTSEPWFVAHYRDKDQVEVDFVLESPQREIIGIEVKAAASVSSADFKGLRRLRAVSGEAFLSGIVLYDGTQALSFGEGLWAVPLTTL
jgi:predicted AAA+ superfamily ATPase